MYSYMGDFSTHHFEPINRAVGNATEINKNAVSVVAIEIGAAKKTKEFLPARINVTTKDGV